MSAIAVLTPPRDLPFYTEGSEECQNQPGGTAAPIAHALWKGWKGCKRTGDPEAQARVGPCRWMATSIAQVHRTETCNISACEKWD